jgi:hypothetical protein
LLTGVSRGGKLIALASDIGAARVDVGSFAFLGQALVQTTLPHSDPGVSSFERTSGPVSLSIVADPRGAASKTCCSLIKHSFSGIPSGRMIGFRGQAA